MDERETKRLIPPNNTQTATVRRLWIFSVGSLLALVIGSILAASWLQSSDIVQMMLSPANSVQREHTSPVTGASSVSTASLSTSLTPTTSAQIMTAATPIPSPSPIGLPRSIKPTLEATTVAVLPEAPITRLPITPIPATSSLSVSMYFPSGYAIPAGESLTFNDIISNAPNRGRTTTPITLSQTIPAGLSAIKAFGTGWTITSQPTQGPGTLKAIYTNTVMSGDSASPLTIFGIIARNAHPVLHMNASVSTTGDAGNKNEESAADFTVIAPLTPSQSVTKR